MALVKYLVKKEDIKKKCNLINHEEPIALIGTKEAPIYIVTVGLFYGKVYISVYDEGNTKDPAIEETLVEDKEAIIEAVEEIVISFSNLIDAENEELEKSSFYICDNPECSENFVHDPFYLNGKWLCPECGEEVRREDCNKETEEVEEIDPERLKDIAALLISGLIDEYGASVFQIECDYGITLEEIEYITGC